MTPPEPTTLDIALLVARALERIGVPYFLGGSLASSMQGEPRATNDIDFVVDMSPDQASALARELGTDFEVDVEALADHLRRGGSWNIYYTKVLTKIDLFRAGHDPFDESEFARRRRLPVRRDGSEIVVKSAEDTVLRKLLWFRAGGEVSSKQWRDVVEVLRVSGASMERGYLDQWAKTLRIDDLLRRADNEAAGV
jgi:hypothetical protein